MSARIPTRRIGHTALSTITRPTYTQTRPLSLKNPFKKRTDAPDYSNPVLAELLQDQARKQRAATKIDPPMPAMGSLAPTSIFKPEVELAGYRDDMTPEEKERLRETEAARKERLEKEKNLRLQGYVLDPDPKKRELWERRKVIEGIQRRGRVTRDVKLARTERELRWKSINFQTSTKKLTKLMNQIAGKTMEEALVQMRFSKKRVARDVVKGLLMARDEAIVRSGMGLGGVKPTPIKEVELEQKEDESEEDFEARKAAVMAAKAAALEERLLSPGTYLRAKPEDAITIELKDGTRKKVSDPTEIYIDQAWVGKGESWRSIECRARGMTNLLRHRTTSFSVILKEEKTRMRISEEIKKKRDNRKLWTALPDRPITAQRQYCLW